MKLRFEIKLEPLRIVKGSHNLSYNKIHSAFVIRPSCVPEGVGVHKKGQIKMTFQSEISG